MATPSPRNSPPSRSAAAGRAPFGSTARKVDGGWLINGRKIFASLSGAANFRTLDVDDVLLPGKDYGVMTTLRAGTNGFDYGRLLAGATRTDLGEGEVGIVGALSDTKRSPYENGDGNISVKVEGHCSYSSTDSLFFTATVLNALATLP